MNKQAEVALVDPATQITKAHFWWPERLVSAGLTVNLGME
jgi:hypothetical protein